MEIIKFHLTICEKHTKDIREYIDIMQHLNCQRNSEEKTIIKKQSASLTYMYALLM